MRLSEALADREQGPRGGLGVVRCEDGGGHRGPGEAEGAELREVGGGDAADGHDRDGHRRGYGADRAALYGLRVRLGAGDEGRAGAEVVRAHLIRRAGLLHRVGGDADEPAGAEQLPGPGRGHVLLADVDAVRAREAGDLHVVVYYAQRAERAAERDELLRLAQEFTEGQLLFAQLHYAGAAPYRGGDLREQLAGAAGPDAVRHGVERKPLPCCFHKITPKKASAAAHQ